MCRPEIVDGASFKRPAKLLSVVPTHLFFSVLLCGPPSWWLITCLITDVNNFVCTHYLFIVPLNEMLCCLVNCEFRKANFLLFLSLCELLFFSKIPTLWCFRHSKPAVQNNNSGQRWPPYCFVQMTCNQGPKRMRLRLAYLSTTWTRKKNPKKRTIAETLTSVPHGPSN